MTASAERSGPETGVMVAQTELKGGALGLGAVLAQAITHIAPAAGFLLGVTFIASKAGHAVSLAYGLAFLVCLSIGLSLIQLARHLPSAGGYFTYVSRTLHPRFGFLTAWLYFLYDPTAVAINFTILGIIFEKTLNERLGINAPWPIWVALGIIFVTAIIYRGVKISGRTLIVLASIEIAILLAFALSGFLSPGPGGFTFATFTVDNSTPDYGVNGLFLGVVFAIFAFTGFESVAPMAEESQNPRRNLSLAIVLSLILMGAFYLFTTWGLAVGWGIDQFSTGDAKFAGGDVNAFIDLAQRLWGSGWILLLLALLNSILAVGISASNAATRVFFSMGRAGILPRWLGAVHPTYKTPANAIILQTVITVIVAYAGGWWLGPDNLFFVLGLVITFGLVLVYGVGNIGVIRYYWAERRDEFNWFWHVVIPVVSTLAILAVGYYSLQGLDPNATFPSNLFFWAPWFVLAWLGIGVVVLAIARLRGGETWLLKAGEVAYERPANPEDLA
jgi:amino acid transporter